MIALQRHRQILDRVAENGAARVVDLARDFRVTEETIRRDLRTLSERGMVERTHGGAVAVDQEDGRIDLPYDHRDASHASAKDAIARAALSMITPHQVIALDASSTAAKLAHLLPDEPLTVVTNSLVICGALAPRKQIEVVCTGGTLDREALAFYGLQTRRALATLNIEQFFFSVRGIDTKRGLSEANDRHAAVKLSMFESAQRRVLLADTSKLGLASRVFFAPVGEVDRVVLERSDNPAVRDAVARLGEHGLEIQEAEPAL
ncbi:MAG: DeoR/GlpR family DNA-binding transcription regulator [Planctomycetota bacterium]